MADVTGEVCELRTRQASKLERQGDGRREKEVAATEGVSRCVERRGGENQQKFTVEEHFYLTGVRVKIYR